jgi:signal transduction histidine kinase
VLLPPEEHASARDLVRQALTFGVGQRCLGTLLTCDGRQRRIAWSAKALSGDPADEAAVLILGHDITELEEAQRHALQAERLAAIGQAAASLAHESRNALQRTQACLERLTWRLKGRPEELDLATRARAAQDNLARLFDEVRTYAAPLRLDISPCSLADIWREAWQQVRGVVADRPAALHEQLGGTELWCSVDSFRLTQVFRNIFENAFAACSGPVRIGIVCTEMDNDGRPALRVAIADNGPGLGPEPHERLFEPFYTTKPRGSGLGLAIARRLVEAHAGRISAASAAGGGAEIQIIIPRSPP